MFNINYDMLKMMTPEERERLAASLDKHTDAVQRNTSATRTTTGIFALTAIVTAIAIVITVRG